MLESEDDPVLEECVGNSNEHTRKPTSFAGMLSARVRCWNLSGTKRCVLGVRGQAKDKVRFSKLLI
jgi:hypothetical protein